MPQQTPDVIGRGVEQVHVWLNQMQGGDTITDKRGAYAALRAVLHHLRDRLPVDEAAHLGGQLPTFVRGIFYEGWKPAATPTRDRSFPDFVEACRPKLKEHPEIDPEEAVARAFHVLKQHVDAGQMDHVFDNLPQDLRQQFWGPAH